MYSRFCNPSLRRMFLSIDLLVEYCIQHVAIRPFCVKFSFQTRISYKDVAGFATDCSCSLLISSTWSNSLIIRVYSAASARIHVLVPPPYKWCYTILYKIRQQCMYIMQLINSELIILKWYMHIYTQTYVIKALHIFNSCDELQNELQYKSSGVQGTFHINSSTLYAVHATLISWF